MCLFSVLLFSIFPVPGRADGLKDVAIRGKEKKKNEMLFNSSSLHSNASIVKIHIYYTRYSPGFHQESTDSPGWRRIKSSSVLLTTEFTIEKVVSVTFCAAEKEHTS